MRRGSLNADREDAVADEPDDGVVSAAQPRPEPATQNDVSVRLSPSNLWRAGLVLLGVVAFGLLIRFVLEDGGSVIFTVLMSWFAAIAMAPIVDRLSRHMRRGLATGLVMVAAVVFVVVFFVAFGSLFVDQLTQLVLLIPDLVDGVLSWVNSNFSTSLSRDEILASINLSPQEVAATAASLGISLIGFLGSVVGSVFGLFTFGLFVFYLSADMPQFARWVAGLFPARSQQVVATVWSLTAQKTGGYVGARVILAAINSITTGIVFVIIGMPYWLPLALWTGIVAQFVPTIGTYISIILPVIVGLLSPNPWLGVIALAWAVAYQQVENLTIEPKISAKAVDVNPAVAFGAVLLGAALFGVAGAFLAVPVAAMLLALLDIYGNRYELLPPIEKGVERIEYHPGAHGRHPKGGRGPTTSVEASGDSVPE
jgi:predicted PurR-regulated permease PerM